MAGTSTSSVRGNCMRGAAVHGGTTGMTEDSPGGVTATATATGRIKGVEAVIDKDLTAALLAETVDAEMLSILTDVPAVWTHWPMTEGIPIQRATPSELRALTFAAGSMRPKVEAACRFVERTGREARIGAIEQAEAVMAGTTGTLVRAA